MAENFSQQWMRGSLDLMVLSALADGPKYGYLLQQRLNVASGGRVELKAGTLYPLLHRLEDEKLIVSRWDESTGRRRKWYELTPAGRTRLKKQAHEWEEFARCVRYLLSPVLDPGAEPA